MKISYLSGLITATCRWAVMGVSGRCVCVTGHRGVIGNEGCTSTAVRTVKRPRAKPVGGSGMP